jgi:hypothetical protein
MNVIYTDLSAALAHERINELLAEADESREIRRLPRRQRHRFPHRRAA